MSWRVVTISSVAKLDYKMDYLVVRRPEGITRIHLSEISVLIVESTAVSLTAYLLYELSKHKIEVIFCDEKRMPIGRYTSLYASHDTSHKLRRQIKWDDGTRALCWQSIIKRKILGQLSVLQEKTHADTPLLEEYISQVLPNDETNREGHAAKVYFNLLFGKNFSRTQENEINAALNYGYGILLSVVAREIEVCGYANQIGIFHNNVNNRYNLASDLMEPFRPFVDFVVTELEHSKFDHDDKMYIVRMLNRMIDINERSQSMLNAIKISVKSILDAISDNDLDLMIFPEYELQIYADDRIL